MARSYVVYIEELDKYVRFVDRDREMKYLLNVIERGTVFPLTIYGPEGCGKTALLRRVAREVSSWGNAVVIYIDALEQFDVEKALFSSHREIFEVIRDLLSMPVGDSLARASMAIVSRLSKKISLRNRNVVLIVDDVYRAIGLENVDRYTKSLYEWIGYLHEEYGVANVAIILSTSEGVSKRELFRHRYVSIEMLWNLPRDGFEELAKQLEPPSNIDVDELWRLTGGNPRALIELARFGWSAREWLESIRSRVEFLVRDLDRDRLRSVVEDPDSDWSIAERLEELNLMIYLIRGALAKSIASPDPEMGIGRYWAWQLPAYRYVVKEIASSAT